MAVTARRAVILHCAINRDIEPTVTGIAAATGLSRWTVWRTLRGDPVSPRTAERLAAALGVTEADLFELTGAEAAS